MFLGDPLLSAIKIMGSRQNLCKAIGITIKRLDRWLNGNVTVPYEYALALEFLTFGKITAAELSPKRSQIIKKLKINFNFGISWLERKELNTSLIKISGNSISKFDDLEQFIKTSKENITLNTILIDVQYKLIFGEHILNAYKLMGKTTIATIIISFEELLSDGQAEQHLARLFSLSERIAIGIALEDYIKFRHGGNRKQIQVHKYALEGGKKARDTVAAKIGIGSHFTYEQGKKLLAQGHQKLINVVDEGKLKISAAAILTILPKEEQQKIDYENHKYLKEIIRQLKAKNKIELFKCKSLLNKKEGAIPI